MQIAIEQPIQADALVREVVMVGMQLGGAFGLLILRLRHFEQGGLARGLLSFDGLSDGLQPGEILGAKTNDFIRQRGSKGGFGQFPLEYLKLVSFLDSFGRQIGLSDAPGELWFAEKREFLVNAVNHVAIAGAKGLAGGYAAQPSHGIFPGADSAEAGGGGIGAGARCLKGGVFLAHFLSQVGEEWGAEL